MAAFTSRTRDYTEYRWELRTPTNAVEYDKARRAAATEWHAVHRTPSMPDDALTLTAEDDLLVISFTEEEQA